MYYDDSYSRDLWSPDNNCTNGTPDGPPGAEIVFDESIDYNMSDWLGGGEDGVKRRTCTMICHQCGLKHQLLVYANTSGDGEGPNKQSTAS